MTRSAIFRLPIMIALCAASTSVASAQTQSVAPASTGQTATETAPKVWTNENIASAGSSSSNPRQTAASNAMPASRPKAVSIRGRNVRWYRDQIVALQARIPPMDAQIGELQSALDGKASGDGKTSQRPRFAQINQWPAQLRDLQTRRQTILGKIDALRDEARHNGVPPNALP